MNKQSLLLAPAVALLLTTAARADFTNPQTPEFRGDPSTEYGKWDTFTVPFGGVNLPDDASSSSLDVALENFAPSAFLVPPPGGNIYSPTEPLHIELTDTSPTALLEVHLQVSTKGAELDYSGVVLQYLDAQNQPQNLAWDSYTQLALVVAQGIDVESLFTWDLSNLGESITSYKIIFEGETPSLSLDAVILDTRSFAPFETYCTGLVSTAGCLPQISGSGTASSIAFSPFDIAAVDVLSAKSGLLFYGTQGEVAIPFAGGTLCVQPPLRRTPIQYSGVSANPCGGLFSYDFNARIQSGIDPLLVPGVEVHSQYWGRDPQAALGAQLTNGLRFTILD